MIGVEHGAMHCKQVTCITIFSFFNAKLTIKKGGTVSPIARG